MSARIRQVAVVLAAVLFASPVVEDGRIAEAQGAPAGARPVDARRVDEAIRNGVEFLKTSDSPPWAFDVSNSDELILLTFIHAGVAENNPKFKELLSKILEAPLKTTYKAAVQAMVLEELQRVKYQWRILQCAQFLLDNQAKNGQWSYGTPTEFPKDLSVPTPGAARPEEPTLYRGSRNFGPERRDKPKVVQTVRIKKTRDGPRGGDNSNSQYAALGLRACHDAGVIFPVETISLARSWWVESQIAAPGGKDASVATGTGLSGTPQGWCYRGYHRNLKWCKDPDTAYASMTAGAVGALAIYNHLFGMDLKKDRALLNGLAWMGKNLSWTENVGPTEMGGSTPKAWLYYYFYAVERVGMLCDIAELGGRNWYAEGANVLLDAQRPDGSWRGTDGNGAQPTWDTCFAILFLKRATRPLDVMSEDKVLRR